MKNTKRHLSWLLVLAMAISLIPAAVFADDALPVPVEESSIVWDSEAGTLTMPGTAGQEYAIVEYDDGTLDWADAIEADETGSVQFSGIEKNCTYDIFTRVKGAEGAAMTLFSAFSGDFLPFDPDPEEGLKEPQWFSQMPEYPEEGDAETIAVDFSGSADQEYAICEKGQEPDWNDPEKTAKPDEDGYVVFPGLTPATAYTISTRPAGQESPIVSADVVTILCGSMAICDAYEVGRTLTVTPTPENAKVTYEWCRQIATPIVAGEYEGMTRNDYFPIEGQAASSYVMTEDDLGKLLAVRFYAAGEEIHTMEDLGPVEAFGSNEDVLPFLDVPFGAYYRDAVEWAAENGVTGGTSPTTFSPDAACTRGQMVTFLWAAAGSPEPESTENPFADVTENDYFYKPVLWAVENGITAGVSADKFGPAQTVTRGQCITLLYNEQGRPEAGSEAFDDVNDGDYFAKAVAWGVENGITAGVSKTAFGPAQPCTRGQIVTFLFNAKGN
ncbi:MAG: S-layer homology domain-containing protein [Firmicutes bacterium]|nr:S-layer homology domain-containing protein [Bacillota bacterium]